MKLVLKTLITTYLLIAYIFLTGCKKEEKNIPVLITVPASSIKATTAIIGGQIAFDGGTEVIERGACWGTEPNPDLSGSKTKGGKGTGIFKCKVTGLIPGTLYYARVYATNRNGTAYGGEVRFTTGTAGAPTVFTLTDQNRTSFYGANIGISIPFDGGAPVDEKGVCWGPDENPTITENEKSINSEMLDTNSVIYWTYISPLTPGTSYHARAYAINAAGISYGNDRILATKLVPEVTTLSITGISGTTATADGNLITNGDVASVETGICFSTAPNPIYYNYRVKAETTSPGQFTCNLTGLSPGTTYYVRTYVFWQDWDRHWYVDFFVYGDEMNFTTKAAGSGN